MKKIILIILLLFGCAIYAQSRSTSPAVVSYLMKQIQSLNFEKTDNPNASMAFVGKANGIEVYWYRVVETHTITYLQILVNSKLNASAKGHTIETDLEGNNAIGTHEEKLNYKPL